MATTIASTPAHYIRSIHTSFTAAHPRNAHHGTSWASRASQAQVLHSHRDMHADSLHGQYTHHQQHHHSYQVQNPHSHQQYVQPGSINTHNQHNYAHHLQALGAYSQPHPQQQTSYQQGYQQAPLRRKQSGSRLGAMGVVGQPQQQQVSGQGQGQVAGRRRSASIRMPPTYVVPTQRGRPATNYKFDPFADDDALALSVTTPLTTSSNANRLNTSTLSSLDEPLKPQYTHSVPYTIHIPAAQPTEIQRYTPAPAHSVPSSPRPSLRSLIPINGPLPGTAPTTTATSTTLSRSPSPPSPSTPRNTLSRSPSPPGSTSSSASMAPRRPTQVNPNPNLSKIVAGILLNRVHAVGKPMRRRVLPRAQETDVQEYRKSCLSSVISVEA